MVSVNTLAMVLIHIFLRTWVIDMLLSKKPTMGNISIMSSDTKVETLV